MELTRRKTPTSIAIVLTSIETNFTTNPVISCVGEAAKKHRPYAASLNNVAAILRSGASFDRLGGRHV